MVDLVYLGRLIDITGTPAETVQLPEDIETTADLRTWLNTRFAETGRGFDASVRIALDSEICAEPSPLGTAREIAFLPPVGGG